MISLTKHHIKHGLQRVIQAPIFWICALAFVLLWTLLTKQEFWTGYDTYFHMNSIYEDAMQIKTGHYSYFLSLFGFERSGRIVNSVYSPVFNYICGALLLLCHQWVRFEFVIFFATLSISGIGTYKCAKLLGLSQLVSITLALFYMTSHPVLVMWIGNFEFTGLGATILLPFILMEGIKISRQHQIKVLPLSLLMAICLQVHLITSLIAVLILIPLTIYGFILSNNRWKMIRNGVTSVLLTICLSGNIFGALYDVFGSNRLIPTAPNFNLQSPQGGNAISIQQHMITDLWQPYTLFIMAIIILIIIRFRSVTILDWVLLGEDCGFLWLSSKYFPWNALSRIFPKLMIIIQFPARFTVAPFLLTLLLLGRLITIHGLTFKWQAIINGLFCITFIMSLPMAFQHIQANNNEWNRHSVVHYWVHFHKHHVYYNVTNSHRIRNAFRSSDLSRGIHVIHKTTLDYSPTKRDFNKYYFREHLPYNPSYKLYEKTFRHQNAYHKYAENHGLSMTWRSHNDKRTVVPLVKYGNTVVTLNHRRISPKKSLVGTMKIKPQMGINHLSIRYQPGHIFKIMSIVSIFSWLILLLSVVCQLIIKVSKHEN